jgi:hypothetical protein
MQYASVRCPYATMYFLGFPFHIIMWAMTFPSWKGLCSMTLYPCHFGWYHTFFEHDLPIIVRSHIIVPSLNEHLCA